MKLKTLLLAFASTALVACSSTGDDATETPGGIPKPTVNSHLYDTQLFAGILDTGLENNGLQSISESSTGLTKQSILPEAKTSPAYFSVRMDGYLNQVNTNGGSINMNNDYYPLPVGGSVPMLATNTGTVYTNYPAIEYGEDHSKHMQSYVFSTDGSATATIMQKVPSDDEVLKSRVNETKPYIVLDYDRMPADVDKSKLHIIWYVVKLLDYGDKAWHVDGVLTDLDDIRQVMARTPSMSFWEVGNLEPMSFDKNNATLRYDEEVNVDVNQQAHTDWGEIKTTIHLKTAKDVKVTLPITDPVFEAHPELLENIAARDYELPISLESYNNKFFASINVRVERNANGVVISLTGLTPVVLQAIEDQYADGLTIEVHTFTSATDAALSSIWRQLCNSKVETEAKVSGQITSAYKTAATDKRVFNEKGEAVYGGINDPNAQ